MDSANKFFLSSWVVLQAIRIILYFKMEMYMKFQVYWNVFYFSALFPFYNGYRSQWYGCPSVDVAVKLKGKKYAFCPVNIQNLSVVFFMHFDEFKTHVWVSQRKTKTNCIWLTYMRLFVSSNVTKFYGSIGLFMKGFKSAGMEALWQFLYGNDNPPM